jgi:hypothetical protein
VNETIALQNVSVLRPLAAANIEVTIAGTDRRRFPPRLSETLGICLKRGPQHLVRVNGRELGYPADALCVRAPGCVWECTTEPCAFVCVDIPAAFLADAGARSDTAATGAGMRFADPSAVDDLEARVRRLLAADSPLLAEELVADLVMRVSDAGGLDMRVERGPARAVERARELIHAAVGQRLTLEMIAAADQRELVEPRRVPATARSCIPCSARSSITTRSSAASARRGR